MMNTLTDTLIPERFKWEQGSSNEWNLRVYGLHLWIEPRPWWCDRGHFAAKIDGLPDVDTADQFPRYFMRLSRAMEEMEEWLLWRLIRLQDTDPASFEALKQRRPLGLRSTAADPGRDAQREAALMHPLEHNGGLEDYEFRLQRFARDKAMEMRLLTAGVLPQNWPWIMPPVLNPWAPPRI